MKLSCAGNLSWWSDGKGRGLRACNTPVKGPWSELCGTSSTGKCLTFWRGAQSPLPECLSVWVPWEGMSTCGEASPHAVNIESWQHADGVDCHDLHRVQGWQPYVAWDRWFENPFPQDQDMHTHDISVGGDPFFSTSCRRGRCMADAAEMVVASDPLADARQPEMEETPHCQTQCGEQFDTHESKQTWVSSTAIGSMTDGPLDGGDAIRPTGALPLRSSEQLGSPRLAISGTLAGTEEHHTRTIVANQATQQQLLGGGKRAREDQVWEDEPDQQQYTSPGRLQNRLQVLQQRAKEAIDSLPIECREDVQFGMHETRVWGLEALKHVLKMRLALQSNLYLCRPVETEPAIPPSVELLAANLTLNIHNKGNRCFANAVLRMWCWIGAHHPDPAAFWGPSTKLCMQILQQDEIPDIFWASELQPAIARLENPQNQHDASEFLVHLWELWGQTGLQGNWHAHFGGRWHEYDTIPLYIRMPVEMGDEVHFEQLLAEWANEGNGQCLGADVEHIVFHVGRYHLCPQKKSWIKHHHLLHTPSTFRCPQRTQAGHTGQSMFVLRGIIGHQGPQLISGHYVTMLVEGEAVWIADDGRCPEAKKEVPIDIKRDTVMIWASRAEQSSFGPPL